MTLKSVKPNSQVNGKLQVDDNLEVYIESQIKPNQIKAQIEIQKKVKANVWPNVK